MSRRGDGKKGRITMLSMEAVLGVVNAKTRGGVSRTGEIEVQCPMGVCGHKKKPVYFSVNLERGQYNCFHCCSGCPYSGGIVDLFCLFNGLDLRSGRKQTKRWQMLWMVNLSSQGLRSSINRSQRSMSNRMKNWIRYTEQY